MRATDDKVTGSEKAGEMASIMQQRGATERGSQVGGKRGEAAFSCTHMKST